MYKGKRLLYTGKALQSQDNNHMYRMYRIILIKFLKNNPALKDVDAVKNNRIYKIGLIDLAPGIRNSKAVGKLYNMFYGNEK